jgi:pyruvate dehydrogenase E2 component (dihydrolipoamide acetyltransferase)
MAEITMPRLSDTMEEGTVSKWLKQPGDRVEVGDIIAEIETDKATMELEAFESGTLQKILVPEGKTVPIGEPIALIGEGPADVAEAPAAEAGAQPATPPPRAAPPTEEGGAAARARTSVEERAAAPPPSAAPQPVRPAEARPPVAERGDGRERIKASPVARRLAAEMGVDLRQVHGTGPGGRIIKENVEEFHAEMQRAPAVPAPAAAPAAPAARPAPAPAGEVVPLSRMRRAIARAMTESKPGTPHIYVTAEIDMGEAMKLRKQLNDSGAADVKISVNDLVVKAAARALRKFPALNSSYATTEDGQPGVVRHDQINVSVAVALEDGLIAPVVKDADKKSLGTIAAEIKDMAGRAREGKIKQTELEGATFQVSNLGMYDVVDFVSVITPPQAASLSVGAVRQTPVVRDGQIVIGEMMYVTLSADHRVTDGATAAQYLQEVRRLLQSPLSLLV